MGFNIQNKNVDEHLLLKYKVDSFILYNGYTIFF